jgi:hypothetical protein
VPADRRLDRLDRLDRRLVRQRRRHVIAKENQVRKPHFLSTIYIQIIILPRQAQGKHRENSQKVYRFLAGLPASPVSSGSQVQQELLSVVAVADGVSIKNQKGHDKDKALLGTCT